jgi:hypothetical protein
MKNKCHQIEKKMSMYIYDELSGKDKNKFEDHVNTCSNCSLKLAVYKKTKGLITEKQTPVPNWEQSWLNIRKHLIDHQRKEKSNRYHMTLLKWTGGLAGSVAIFLLGILVGIHVINSHPPHEIPDTSAYIFQEFQEHIENIKPVIIEYANYWRSVDTPPNIPVEKERVINLLIQNQMLLCRLPNENNRYMQQLLNELNGILTKIALATWEDPAALFHIKKMIQKKGLLFKIETLPLAKDTEIAL